MSPSEVAESDSVKYALSGLSTALMAAALTAHYRFHLSCMCVRDLHSVRRCPRRDYSYDLANCTAVQACALGNYSLGGTKASPPRISVCAGTKGPSIGCTDDLHNAITPYTLPLTLCHYRIKV